ncbi:hypothetical protein C5B96_03725 [Subtercola sp. Z020]|uniref:HNH endonuclease n=1 Tax=Subtercola sp. Z020 TaxID=2080582 RepID=UPI000CE75652|nr:HNH endonuclease [Subtercola sp. Z020]PPF87823.1 hypothetical protein C5B96_03725 [Subtercola sp. Z020]
MTDRTDLVRRIVDLSNGSLEITRLGTGWPSAGTLLAAGSSTEVNIFSGRIGLSHRSRDSVERRFQNPATAAPLESEPGRASILLGLWEDDEIESLASPVIAMAEAARREGRVTRWSVFLSLEKLLEASYAGWSTQTSHSAEVIQYFRPELLPLSLTASLFGSALDEGLIQKSIRATGLLETAEFSPTSERVRRAVSVLVRDARFSGRVLDAYGRACAMCGLAFSLVQGAHIYPASAPGSVDRIVNGVALCANHHLAFDRHIIGVDPFDLTVTFRPDVVSEAQFDPAVRHFILGTFPSLRLPAIGNEPDSEMFIRRYEFFGDEYRWLGSFT